MVVNYHTSLLLYRSSIDVGIYRVSYLVVKVNKKNILRGEVRGMNKFEAVDKFQDELMEEFLKLCNYNDYNKINLLTIGDTVYRIYEKCIDDMVNEDEKCIKE